MEGAVLTLVTAMAVLFIVTSVLVYLQLRQIHRAVNSNMTTALNKIDELHARVAVLVEAGPAA